MGWKPNKKLDMPADKFVVTVLHVIVGLGSRQDCLHQDGGKAR